MIAFVQRYCGPLRAVWQLGVWRESANKHCRQSIAAAPSISTGAWTLEGVSSGLQARRLVADVSQNAISFSCRPPTWE